MVPWRASDDGFVTDDVIDWYARFARGRPGVLVVEATGIRDVPSGPLLRIGHDRFLPGLVSLVDAVREASDGHTRLFIQIIDFVAIKRRPPPEKFFRRFLRVDDALRQRLSDVEDSAAWRTTDEHAVREHLLAAPRSLVESVLDARALESLDCGQRERIWDMHLPHIRELPQVLPSLFAAAAGRARDAGFDGVELHYAHAYTMASFLSPLNVRNDGYGGDREGRVRLPLEVLAAVRRQVASDIAVGIRFLADEVIDGGFGVEEAAWFGSRFAEAGVDVISLSKGGKFEDAKQPRIGEAAYPYTGPSGHECMPTVLSDERGPFARNAPLAAAVRRAVREAGHETPVVTAGGIGDFATAEGILKRGEADIVAAARQSLADPDWWLKMNTGRGDEVRRCEFTNYCEGLDQRHKQVTCKLWDRKFDRNDAAISRSHDGKRRLLAPDWS
jgi:2,4-dienoyl-CoA reductase-like NADH-dependent reductase (Old Yellow Enzyme family)